MDSLVRLRNYGDDSVVSTRARIQKQIVLDSELCCVGTRKVYVKVLRALLDHLVDRPLMVDRGRKRLRRALLLNRRVDW